jgi:hypothetical protein
MSTEVETSRLYIKTDLQERDVSASVDMTGMKVDMTGKNVAMTGMKVDMTGIKVDMTGMKVDMTVRFGPMTGEASVIIIDI